MNLLKHLRSNTFALIIAILSVIVQSFHSFTAFYNTSSLQNGWGIAQAVLFSVVIDLAILFYTVRQRRDIATFAAVAMVVINAYYYYNHLGLNFQFIFGCFLSLIIPVSVYYYSEEIKEESNAQKDKDKIKQILGWNVELHDENGDLKKRCEEYEHHLKMRLDGEDNWRKTAEAAALRVKELERDLDYSRNQIKLEELIPDPIEDKKESIRITRTGGPTM